MLDTILRYLTETILKRFFFGGGGEWGGRGEGVCFLGGWGGGGLFFGEVGGEGGGGLFFGGEGVCVFGGDF